MFMFLGDVLFLEVDGRGRGEGGGGGGGVSFIDRFIDLIGLVG